MSKMSAKAYDDAYSLMKAYNISYDWAIKVVMGEMSFNEMLEKRDDLYKYMERLFENEERAH